MATFDPKQPFRISKVYKSCTVLNSLQSNYFHYVKRMDLKIGEQWQAVIRLNLPNYIQFSLGITLSAYRHVFEEISAPSSYIDVKIFYNKRLH